MATRVATYSPTGIVTYAPPGSAPWALEDSGPGTVGIVGGVLRFTLPQATAADHEGTFSAPRAVLTHGKSGLDLDVAVRIDSLTFEAVYRDQAVALVLYLENDARTINPGVRIQAEGHYDVGYTIGGGWTPTGAGGLGLLIPPAAQLWVRLCTRGGFVGFRAGYGATYPAADLELYGCARHMGASYGKQAPTKLVIALTNDGGGAVDLVADVGMVTVNDLRVV